MQRGRSKNGQFGTRWEQTSPEQINFLCHFPVGNRSIIDSVADDSGVGSRRYSVARGHSCATNCDRKHLDIRARSNELLGSNIRNNTSYPQSDYYKTFLVTTRAGTLFAVDDRRKSRSLKFILKFMGYDLRVQTHVLRPLYIHRRRKLRMLYHATLGILRISRPTINRLLLCL